MASNKTYLRASDLPDAIPLFPLSGAILLPGGQLPLNIFEPRYLAMFDDAMRGERIIGMIQPETGVDAGPGEAPALRPVGAAGRITQLSETGDGRYFVVLSGIARFRVVTEIESPTPYRQARVDFDSFAEDFAPEETLSSGGGESLRENLNVIAYDLAQALRLDIARKDIEAMPDFDMIAVFAMIGPFNPTEKQALLETPDLVSRADLLLALAEVALTRATNAVKPLQ
jgi:Lon protease-like protein